MHGGIVISLDGERNTLQDAVEVVDSWKTGKKLIVKHTVVFLGCVELPAEETNSE